MGTALLNLRHVAYFDATYLEGSDVFSLELALADGKRYHMLVRVRPPAIVTCEPGKGRWCADTVIRDLQQDVLTAQVAGHLIPYEKNLKL